MAYQNGKTYYLIPTCATGDAAYNQKILNKEVSPLALNTAGVSASHYNKRNVNVYSLDWSTDMQWKVQVYNGFARILCAGNTAFGLDYYYGNDNAGNCDIYKVSGNDEDSKINFRTINASENLYKLQCYRNNVENDLYLTVMPNSSGAFTDGCDVRWQPLDSSKATQQTWWLVPIENVTANTTTTPVERKEVNVTNMPANAGYDLQNLTEIFHPDAGMVEGTWADNNGSTIESQIASFYKTVYSVTPASKLKYLYSLYGGKYTSGEYIGQYHPGVDINLYHGAPIYPSRSGTVVAKGDFYITIQSGNEYLIYVHLNPSSNIGVNSNVIAGETLLGTQSCLGLGLSAEDIANGKNSHLHIEVHKVSTGNKIPQLPAPTVEDYMTITTTPYAYLN